MNYQEKTSVLNAQIKKLETIRDAVRSKFHKGIGNDVCANRLDTMLEKLYGVRRIL
jgi:hypothetical protein